MKISKMQRIILAVIIGFACTLVSLIYQRQATVEVYNNCQSKGVEMSCAQWYSSTEKVTMRGFPLDAISTNDSASITGINIWGLLGNWAIYSTLAFVGLLFWQRKTKLHK